MEEWSQYLKSERLRRGLSLQDIALQAKLSISLLKALEQGRLADIGSAALVRSHLLAYSRALGISQPSSTCEQAPAAAPASATLPDLPRPRGTCLPASKTGVLKLVAFCVIGLMAVGVYYQIDRMTRPAPAQPNSRLSDTGALPESPVRSETPASTSVTTDAQGSDEEPSNLAENRDPPASQEADLIPQQVVEKEPPTTASTESAASEESALSRPPVSLHHRFEIEALQTSWVEVKESGRKTDGFLLRPGEKREWQAVQELQILVGNAGGVQMKWDGAPVNLGGRPGQVLRIRLPHPNLTGKSP